MIAEQKISFLSPGIAYQHEKQSPVHRLFQGMDELPFPKAARPGAVVPSCLILDVTLPDLNGLEF
jgi:hypothetical protein